MSNELTESDKNFIMNNVIVIGVAKCSKAIKKPSHIIHKFCNNNNIKILGKRFQKEEEELIRKIYPISGASECARLTGRNKKSIRYWAIRNKIKLNQDAKGRIVAEGYVSNNFDKLKRDFDKFFDYSNKDVVYALGFVFADGHVQKKNGNERGSIIVKIKKSDGDSLKYIFVDILNFNESFVNPVINKERRGSEQTAFKKRNCLIYDKLCELDFKEKSFVSPTKILNEIPEHMHIYFWRGFFDGDGCISIKHFEYKQGEENLRGSCFFCGQFDQDWQSLCNFLSKHEIKHRIYKKIVKKTGHKQSRVDIINGNAEICKFFKLIFPNQFDNIGLKRKFDKLNILNYFVTM